MASEISDFVREADSEQRLYLHICAVFTCAFTNQMYRVAEKICQDKGLPFEFLQPLLLESAEKASQMSPARLRQVRLQETTRSILKKHIELLEQYPEFRKIYTFVTASILKMNGHSSDFLNSQPAKDE